MLNLTIFSYNRGCQLDLMLRSMKEFFIGLDKVKVNILYRYSSEAFRMGYEKVKKYHPEFNYVLESDFKKNVIELININNFYTVFGVDDNVFKESFNISCDEMAQLGIDRSISCLSLRMHPGITYCYTEDRPTPPPTFISSKSIMWAWQGLPGDWGYNMSVDWHIFKTEDILDMCLRLPYNNPNSFEGQMAVNHLRMPYMMCFEKSKVFNIPANKVQTLNSNRYGSISADFLNSKFLDGYGIDLNPIKGFNNISAHQDVPYEFIIYEG